MPGVVEDADYPPGDPPLSAMGQRQAFLLGQRLRERTYEEIVGDRGGQQ
ncbi:MAG: hypothetical protein O2954_15350 [bacterium]|nr:hypothetical protein [bacterium]